MRIHFLHLFTFPKVRLNLSYFLILFFFLVSFPQNINAQQPIALTGSYASSVTDGVDIFSGRLEHVIPLLNIAGRGEVSQNLYLPLRNQEWAVIQTGLSDAGDRTFYGYEAKLGYVRLGGVVESQTPLASEVRSGYAYIGKIGAKTRHGSINQWTVPAVTTIIFTSNDGSIIEFRDVATNGEPYETRARGCLVTIYEQNPIPQTCSRGRVFQATNGSGATFVANADVYDAIRYDPYFVGDAFYEVHPVSGTLFLSDGSRLIFEGDVADVDGYNTNVSRIMDRNGNYLTFEYSTSVVPGYYFLVKVTDTLKREVLISYGDRTQSTFYDEISYKGFNAENRNIRINFTGVENAMLPGETLLPIFPALRGRCYMLAGGGNVPCPGYPLPPGPGVSANSQAVVSSITLPNNKEYKFYYNKYIELSRIKNPLGSYLDYSYGGAYTGYLPDGFEEPLPDWGGGGSIHRRVKAVKSFDENGQLISEKTFSNIPEILTPSNTVVDNVTVDQKSASGQILARTRHYFYDMPSTMGLYEFSFVPWRYSKEYKTERLNPLTQAVLNKVENSWNQREAFPWCGSSAAIVFYACDETNFPGSSPLNDPRVTEVKATLESGQVSKKTIAYDQFNNVTDTLEYDYGNSQSGQLLKHIHTDFVTDSEYINYTGAHLRRLPLQTWVSADLDGGYKTAFTRYEYDNYATFSLVSRSNVTMQDAINFSVSNIRRGNVTKAISYTSAQNQTGEISSQNQYDILGNVVKTIDAKGLINTIDYSDRFGAPDGETLSNWSTVSPPSQLNGQNTFAFGTSTTNPRGFTARNQYDFFTGAVIDTEDINGNVSTMFHNDPLDRVTQVITANNRPTLRIQKTLIYDDVNKKIVATSDTDVFGDNLSKGETLYNSLGQTIENRIYETNGGYVVSGKFEYDALGRIIKASNPYRPSLNEQPLWTTKTYDFLGRVIKIKTPDNQEAVTDFSGNTVTFTNQGGKKLRNITNSIGQTTRVDEPDNSNSLGNIESPIQPTYYFYNPNGNLIKVTQGQQNRYFLFDSLGRLLRVRQPEAGTNPELALTDPLTGNSQWSSGSSYDANGNVLTTRDPKNNIVAQTYDDLNRVLTRTYSDSTPGIVYEYDNVNVPFSKGQITKVGSVVSTTEFTAFDPTGKVLSHRQTTDGQIFNTSYTYSLSGQLVEETYPSGKIVKNAITADGKFTDVSGKNSGQTSYHSFANSFKYMANGTLSGFRMGNGNWETAQYNSRMQVTQIGLGTSQNATNLWSINYEYGEIDANNNVDPQKNGGSIARESIAFNGLNQPFIQSYKYDSLNRLVEAKETNGGAQTWKQNYGYDRYGNRTAFNEVIGAHQSNQTPNIDPATNHFVSGQGFIYDVNGNLTQDVQGRQFAFNGDNKQIQVKDSVNKVLGLYFYDGIGNRIKKVSDSEITIFVYDALGKLVAEYSNQVAANPTISYLTSDILGSPRVLADNVGNVISRRDFRPFGEEIAADTAHRTVADKYGYGNDGVRKRFTGYEKDIETGLDFAEARMYDNTYGRFTAIDPLLASGQSSNPQTFNRYTYVLNNPKVLTDPTGELPEGLMYGWFGGGTLIGIGIDVLQNPVAPFVAPTDPIWLALNIVFDQNQFTRGQAEEATKATIQELTNTFNPLKIFFNITYSPGTGGDVDSQGVYHSIATGAVEGAINAFLFVNDKYVTSAGWLSSSKKDSGSAYDQKSRQIFMWVGQERKDVPLKYEYSAYFLRDKALSHEMGHLFWGFAGHFVSGNNAQMRKQNESDDGWIDWANWWLRNVPLSYDGDLSDDYSYDASKAPTGKGPPVVFATVLPVGYSSGPKSVQQVQLYRLGARRVAAEQARRR